MSASARAGAAALIVGPLLGLAGNAMLPTLSDDAAPLVRALTAHPGTMVAGLTLQALGIAVLIGGIVWLAVTLLPAAPRLAIAGGIAGVAGALFILFEAGLSAAAPSIVAALDTAHATTAVHQVSTSAASRLDPVSVLFAIGIVMLGFAAVKAGVARWLAPALTVAAVVQTVGFAAASRPLVIIGFAGLAAALALVIRGLQASRAAQPVAQPALAA